VILSDQIKTVFIIRLRIQYVVIFSSSNILVTDIWSINYLTNYYLRRTRALAAISRTGLATSVNIELDCINE